MDIKTDPPKTIKEVGLHLFYILINKLQKETV